MSLYRKEYLTYIGYSPVYKYLPNYNDHSKDIGQYKTRTADCGLRTADWV